tara:strand:+ start:1301 stop:1531 length:231 start_codon:yes stop_codon:yes gene_type:complete
MKILAQYTDTSTFEVPEGIDIFNVHDWHIEWGVLYIQLDEDSEAIEIEKEPSENHETKITFSKDGESLQLLNRGKK